MIETAAETPARSTLLKEDADLYAEYANFAVDDAHTWRESSPEQHLTVSAFVFSPDFTQILLCFHRKGQFWL